MTTPFPVPPPTEARRPRLAGANLVGFITLIVVAVASAGAAGYFFVAPTQDATAGITETEEAEPDDGAVTVTPIEESEAIPARTPDTADFEDLGVGDAVKFGNGMAVRIDAVEPAELWPNSTYTYLLGDDVRAFSLHFTFTNFADHPLETPAVHDIQKEADDFTELDWPESPWPALVHSNSAALEAGVADLDPQGENVHVGTVILEPADSVQGVVVTVDIREGDARVLLLIGDYQEEGQARYVLDVP